MEKSLLRRILNRILHLLARFLPGAHNVRPFLHRLRGVKIQGKIFIGEDVIIENEYPECVEIHDQAMIALRSIIIAHIRGTGKIIIGKKAFIGANCVIAATAGQTLTIGECSVIGASSVVTQDIPPYTFCAGAKTKPILKVTVPFTEDTSYEDFKKGLEPLTGENKEK